MEEIDPLELRRLKRNERERRQRQLRAQNSPVEEAHRRAKDAERKRRERLASNRPNAARLHSARQLEQLDSLATFIRKRIDFTVARCYNRTIGKETNFLTYRDFQILQNRTQWLTDSIIDWHACAVADGLRIDRSKTRIMSCSTSTLLLGGHFENTKQCHLSKEEKRLSSPPSVPNFSKLVFPVCIDYHWVAVEILPIQKKVHVYDSMQNNPARFRRLRDTFLSYIRHNSSTTVRYVTTLIPVPQQTNSDDCGVYVADRIAAILGANNGKASCHDQSSVSLYRSKMLLAAGETIFMNK